MLVVVMGGTPVGGGSRKRGVPTGWARSRADGVGTVGAGEPTEAGAITTLAGDCGRGTRDGVIARRTDGLRPPPDPKLKP